MGWFGFSQFSDWWGKKLHCRFINACSIWILSTVMFKKKKKNPFHKFWTCHQRPYDVIPCLMINTYLVDVNMATATLRMSQISDLFRGENSAIRPSVSCDPLIFPHSFPKNIFTFPNVGTIAMPFFFLLSFLWKLHGHREVRQLWQVHWPESSIVQVTIRWWWYQIGWLNQSSGADTEPNRDWHSSQHTINKLHLRCLSRRLGR